MQVDESELAGPSERLREEFSGSIPPETIREVLRESTAELAAEANVHTFVPMLAERRTRERLSALVRS